jgi:hypothetical protein
MKLIGFALLISVAITQLGFGQSAQEPSGNLNLTLIPTQRPTQFRVELHNSGNRPLVLNVGIALANGNRQYANAVHYSLTMPSGKVVDLVPMEPGFISGRVDPLVMPLPAGATFSFPLDLETFLSIKQGRDWMLHPGRYSLRAQFTGVGVSVSDMSWDVQGIALMPFWTGEAISAPVFFTVPQIAGEKH